jgi:pilus assembly protein CpaB
VYINYILTEIFYKMKFVYYSIITVLAIVAAVLALRFSDSSVSNSTGQQAVAQVTIKTVNVLVASVDIPVGTTIDNSMLDKQPWPENLVVDGFILSNDDSGRDVVGKVSRSSIAAHEPFMRSKLANPNDPGFLAASLPVGMRAITVATDAVSGIAGFVFPGDRVDLLFTHTSESILTPSNGKPSVTEVLGSNIRVLAINVRENDPSKPSTISPSSATLEVSDALAQQIRLAEKNGTLSFSLRSIHDDNPNFPEPTGLNDLTRDSEEVPILSVVRGAGASGGNMTISSVLSKLPEGSEDKDSPVVVNGVSQGNQ